MQSPHNEAVPKYTNRNIPSFIDKDQFIVSPRKPTFYMLNHFFFVIWQKDYLRKIQNYSSIYIVIN